MARAHFADARLECNSKRVRIGGGAGRRSWMTASRILAVTLLVAAAAVGDGYAQGFYAGKTVTVVVGYPPGGSTDLMARTVAEFLPRYVSGLSGAVVRNVPGGAGIAAGNLLYEGVRPDGFTIGLPGRSAWILAKVTGEQAPRYDLLRFDWLGSFGEDDVLVVIRADKAARLGIKSVRDLRSLKEELVFGAWAGATPDVIPRIIQKYSDAKIRVVTGYKGTGDLSLGLIRGDIDAIANQSTPVRVSLDSEIRAGRLRVLARSGSSSEYQAEQLETILPERGRALMRLAHPGGAAGVTSVMPPGSPKEAVPIMRRAFEGLARDEGFQRAAAQRQLDISFVQGNELAKIVQELVSTPKGIIDEYKAMIGR